MNKLYDNYKKTSRYVSKFQKKRNYKVNQRHNLTSEEIKRLTKLEAITTWLKLSQYVQNRQLQSWLNEGKYAQIDAVWQEQLELHEKLKDKPNDLKSCEETLKQATFYYIREEVQCSKGKHSIVMMPSNKMCQVLS